MRHVTGKILEPIPIYWHVKTNRPTTAGQSFDNRNFKSFLEPEARHKFAIIIQLAQFFVSKPGYCAKSIAKLEVVPNIDHRLMSSLDSHVAFSDTLFIQRPARGQDGLATSLCQISKNARIYTPLGQMKVKRIRFQYQWKIHV